MLENLPWRSLAALIAGLAIASCLMAWGIIVATDRVTYTGFDRKAASVGGLLHDSFDDGPRGAWSSPPVR
jgi:hypothetical protein